MFMCIELTILGYINSLIDIIDFLMRNIAIDSSLFVMSVLLMAVCMENLVPFEPSCNFSREEILEDHDNDLEAIQTCIQKRQRL